MKIDSIHAEFMSGNAVSSTSSSHSIVSRDASGDIHAAGVSIAGNSGTLFSYSDGTRSVYGGCNASDPWFGTSSNHDLRLTTNGSERMRIDSTGNIGIGTASPSHALNVTATSGDAAVHIQAQGNAGDSILYFNGASGNQRKCAIISSNVAPSSYCKQDLHFCMETTNDTSDVDLTDSKMVLTNAGNVGIGTNNPSAGKLDIFVPDGGTGIHIRGGNYGTNDGEAHIRIGGGGASSDNISHHAMITGGHTSTGSSYLSFSTLLDYGTHGTSPVERMRINHHGNVGIGTPTPDTKLTVSRGAITASGEIAKFHSNYDSANNGYLIIEENNHTPNNNDWTGYGTRIQKMVDSTYQGYIEFNPVGGQYSTAFGNGTNEYMRIEYPDGNVGIGTAAPDDKLHIYGNDDQLRFQSQRSDKPEINFGWSGTDAENFTMWDFHSNHRAFLYGRKYTASTTLNGLAGWHFYANGSTALRIDSDGNVGIGTTSPESKLWIVSSSSTGSDTDVIGFRSANNTASQRIGYTQRIGFYGRNEYDNGSTLSAAIDCIYGDNAHLPTYPGYSSTNLVFRVNPRSGTMGSSEVMRIQHDGNVGIGTNSPAQDLHIHEDGESLYMRFTTTANSTTDIFDIAQWNSERANGDRGVMFINRANTDIIFDTNDTPRMRIKNNGSVGIGTSTFTDTRNTGGLHLANSKGISFAADSTQSNSRHWRIRNDDYSPWGSLQFSVSDDNSTHPDANDEHVMTMTRERKVGIGTSDPDYNFHVYRSGGCWTMNETSGGALENRFKSSTCYWSVWNNGTDDKMRFWSGLPSNSTGDRVVFDGTGRVGIGTASPKAWLHVRGANWLSLGDANSNYSKSYVNTSYWSAHTGLTTQNWGIYSEYAIGCTGGFFHSNATFSASDERIKKNIVDADDAECLETLRLLKPKKYQYRDVIRRGEEPVWGFIAQEVKETLPYATKFIQDVIPNIYELARVSSSNVITFTNFNTSNLEANATTLIKVTSIDDENHDIHLAEVIDEHTIRVEEDLTKWIGSVDETTGNVVAGNQLFVHGQEVDDFVYIQKEAIWTVTTAALQEVDRQLQAEKARNDALESRITELEGMVSLIRHNMTWPDE